MSWYYGTFYCGHDGYINLNGSAAMRRSMREYRFSQPCPDCMRSEAIRFRSQKNAAAANAAQKQELPVLTGSARQISWATAIRADLLKHLEQYILKPEHLSLILERYERETGFCADVSPDRITCFFRELVYYLQNIKTTAVYWINHRYLSAFQILYEALPDFVRWKKEERTDYLQEHFVSQDSLLAPPNPQHPGFVTIKKNNCQIRVYYEQNTCFQSLMKSQHFHWNGSVWVRNVTEHTGSIADCTAQLGNLLLCSGFRISIDDPYCRQKAVSADFTTEQKRWIQRSINGRQFFVPLPADIATRTRHYLMRIPTASYRYNGILIDAAHYAELEEFAMLFDFSFDMQAKELLTKYKSLLEHAAEVSPVMPQTPDSRDNLRRMLESSDSILTDLCDDSEMT